MAEPTTKPVSLIDLVPLSDMSTSPPVETLDPRNRGVDPTAEALGLTPMGVSRSDRLSAAGAGTLTGLPTGALVSVATIEGARKGYGLTGHPYGARLPAAQRGES